MANDAGGLDFGTYGSVFGGTYSYPSTGQGTATYYDAGGCTGYCGCDTNLAPSTFTAGGASGGWAFSGNVVTYSGAGTWLSPCVNASAFTGGVQFMVSGSTNDAQGDAGNTNQLQLSVWQLSNWGVATAGGTCLAADGGPGDMTQCKPAAYTFSIPGTNTPTAVTVHWTDLKGGLPQDSITDPGHLIQLQLQLPWNHCQTGTAYMPNVSITQIKFF
jgi:hypothetical protein